MRSLLLARKGENAETHLKATYSPSLWILSPLSGRCSKRKESIVLLLTFKALNE